MSNGLTHCFKKFGKFDLIDESLGFQDPSPEKMSVSVSFIVIVPFARSYPWRSFHRVKRGSGGFRLEKDKEHRC